MVVSCCRSTCTSAFFGLLYTYLLFECAIIISANKDKNVSQNAIFVQTVTKNNSAFDKEQLLFRRHRRKLHTNTQDQLSGLDSDNGIQYQEYQGVFGRPGVDFPILARIPITNFNCRNMKNSNAGYYADLETNCQVFHVCDGGRKISFLCPNGTIFRQSHLICDWWFRVDCERSPELFDQGTQLLESDQIDFRHRAEAITNAMQSALYKGVADTMLLESPVSVMNKFNEDFNSESELPKWSVSRKRPDMKPDYQSFNPIEFPSKDSENNINSDLPPPRSHSTGTTPGAKPTLLPKSSSQTVEHFQLFSPITFPSRDSTENLNSELLPARSYSSNTNPGIKPTLTSKTNVDSFNFQGEKLPSVNFNNQNYLSQNTRNKLASTGNLISPSSIKSNYNILSFSKEPIKDGFNNNFNSEFGLPPTIDFNNQNFNEMFFSTFQPKIRTTPVSSDGDFHKQNSNSADNFDNLNFSPTFSPQTTFPITENRFSFTSNPSSSSKSTVSANSQLKTRFRGTQISNSPSQTSFTATTPSWIASNTDVVAGVNFEADVNHIFTPARSEEFHANNVDKFPQTHALPISTTESYTPNTTPFINDFREQQILAETAAFAGSGKYSPFDQFYYPQNVIKQSYSHIENFSTAFPPFGSVRTTLNLDEQYPTTIYPENNFIDTKAENTTSNNTFALYYPSGNNDLIFNLVTQTPSEILFSSVQPKNVSKPAISEFLLNVSLGQSKYADEAVGKVVDQTFPILLTNFTQEAYKQLFPKAVEQNATRISTNSDLQSEHSSGLVQSSSPKPHPIKESFNNRLTAKSPPDLRELAQIFSRALSAYLENPEQFRKILSEVRPTEPPSLEALKSEAASNDEVLAFSEDNERSTPRFPNTRSSANASTNLSTKNIKDPETFAEEINNFMFVNPAFLGQHGDSGEFNVNETYYPNRFAEPFNVTTDITFTVSPLIDITVNHSRMLPTTISEIIPTTLPFFKEPALKNSLYEENITNGYFSDANPQSLSDEQLLITADTQSFVARDNLLKFKKLKYDDALTPGLTSSKYPQFGRRTTTGLKNSFISSKTDFTQTTPATRGRSYNVDTVRTSTSYNPRIRLPIADTSTSGSTIQQNILTTLDNSVTAQTPTSIFNGSAIHAMINMMEEAKTNSVLRSKLVLLLVNDKSRPENTHVKPLISKLLKALLMPPSTKVYDSYSRPQYVKSKQRFNEEIAVFSKNYGYLSPTTPSFVPSEFFQLDENSISRSERATSQPISNAVTKPECSDNLSDADARAVDLLKTLYSIASNNRHNETVLI